MSERGRFYVYRIFDGVVTVYVGKGSGSRLQKQIRRFNLQGEVIEWVKSETVAYEAERRWIKRLKPTDNKNAGGAGGRAVQKRAARRTKAEIEMERIGTRVYAARMLLRFDLRGHISPEQICRLKEIATLTKAC